jgi:hypothetical protein
MSDQNNSAKKPFLGKSQLKVLRWLLIPLFFSIYLLYLKYFPSEYYGADTPLHMRTWEKVDVNTIPFSVVTLAFCLAQMWVARALDNLETTQP